MDTFDIRPIDTTHQSTISNLLREQWGDPKVVSRGKVLDASNLPGFAAIEGDRIVGLITLHIDGSACEVVTLDAVVRGKGLGRTLIEYAKKFARKHSSTRLWLITSNDNVAALAFYQKVGFRIVAVHRDAISQARALKPQIPLVGENGIAIQDEIELEMLICEVH